MVVICFTIFTIGERIADPFIDIHANKNEAYKSNNSLDQTFQKFEQFDKNTQGGLINDRNDFSGHYYEDKYKYKHHK